MNEDQEKGVKRLPTWALLAVGAHTARILVGVCDELSGLRVGIGKLIAQFLTRRSRPNWADLSRSTDETITQALSAAASAKSDLLTSNAYSAAVLASGLASSIPHFDGCIDAQTQYKVGLHYITNAAKSNASSSFARTHGWEAAAELQGPRGQRLARGWKSGPEDYAATANLEANIAIASFVLSIMSAVEVLSPDHANTMWTDFHHIHRLAMEGDWTNETPVPLNVLDRSK